MPNHAWLTEKCKRNPLLQNIRPCKSRFSSRFTDFEGRKPRWLFFFNRSKTHRETSELRNSSERPRKFPKTFGNSRFIFGNSDTLQDKNLTPLAEQKLAGIYVDEIVKCDDANESYWHEQYVPVVLFACSVQYLAQWNLRNFISICEQNVGVKELKTNDVLRANTQL